MKKLLASVALTMLSLTPAMAQDCTATITTVEPGKLTVAAYDYPPFTTAGTDGSISGIDPDIAFAVAKDNCLEVVALVMDPAATTQSVIAGKADIAIGSWNRTEKRTEVLGISAPTYLDPMGILSKDGIDTVEGLVGKKVGTVSGYLWVEQMQALLGENLAIYPNAVALAQDLAAGRIDAAADGYNYAAYAQSTAGAYEGIKIKLAQPDERISASVKAPQAGILYTKGNDSLGAAIDATIARLTAEGAITKAIVGAGFDARVAEVGEPWLVK
jgi:polar amino acid transport system substrate-binding protein